MSGKTQKAQTAPKRVALELLHPKRSAHACPRCALNDALIGEDCPFQDPSSLFHCGEFGYWAFMEGTMSTERQWTYHFHAEAYGLAGETTHRDGLIHSSSPIRSEDAFIAARESIRKEMLGNPSTIVVTSFTFLHGPEIPQ